ncbi:MAG: hypothetical protein AAF479_05075 [Pseudomonadota bacterium]
MDREDRILAYLQDRLDPEGRAAFETEITTDPALSSEIAALRAARQEFASEPAEGDSSAGWERLSASIDQAEMNVAAPANTPRAPRFAIWQVAAVVAAAIMVWEVALSPQFETSDPARYQTVSESANGPVLQVIFKEGASIGEISAVLKGIDGAIVDGPSAIGLYRIGFADADALSAAREALTQRTDLVETVVEQ